MNLVKHIIVVFLVNTSIIHGQSNCENDSMPPIIECLTFSQIIVESGEDFQFWPIDFLTNFTDNCIEDQSKFIFGFTPDLSVSSSFVKTIDYGCDVATDGFAVDQNLFNQDSITVYVSDQNQNISNCKTKITVDVRPKTSGCNLNFDVQFDVYDVNRNITYERVPSIKVLLSRYDIKTDSMFFTSPERLGQGYIYIPTFRAGRIIIKPYEFVSVFLEFKPLTSEFITGSDLLLIQNHILGISPFTEDWQFIAADVNSDDEVNILDLVLLRNIILNLPNSSEYTSHKIVLENDTLSENGFLDTSKSGRFQDLEYTLIRMGDLNDQSN